ncbi:VirB3 family type IV secretion system protein, partial [Acidiphilium multivorum]
MTERQRDPLFVAATRPALFLGLPIEMAVVIIMIGAMIVIFGHNPFYLTLVLPLWFG